MYKDKVISYSSQFSYAYVMMNMKVLAVVTPSSIYHDCFTQKTLWEEKFTLGDFTAVNMKICGRRNVRKHRDSKGRENYVTLDISLKLESLDKMKITSSESKDNFRRSGKELVTSMGLKAKSSPKKYKKTRYAIRNDSKNDLSLIIREFEKLPYENYERRRPKHEPTDSYFYLARHLAKCVVISDVLNLQVYHVRTEMTNAFSHGY